MKFTITNDHLIIGIFLLALIYIFDCQNNTDVKDKVRKNQKIKKLKSFNKLNRQGLIEKRYRERVENKFVEPKRDYENSRGIPINIRTRGKEPQFQSMGFLYREESNPDYNKDDTNRLMLFGRPEWAGSSKFDYYVTTSGNSTIKIPLSNEKELYDGDELEIVGFAGKFKLKLYEVSQIKYIPYL
jgi:hypothetical protein